jgi:hypothetical protein
MLICDPNADIAALYVRRDPPTNHLLSDHTSRDGIEQRQEDEQLVRGR